MESEGWLTKWIAILQYEGWDLASLALMIDVHLTKERYGANRIFKYML